MLLHELGLPPPEDWPKPHTLSDALAPLPDTEVSIHDAPQLRREERQAETIAFRLAGTRAVWGGGIGFMSGFAIGVWLELHLTFWLLTLGLFGLGLVIGRRRASPTCTACARNVPSGAPRCPNCSAKLVGDIRELADHFAAEDEYRRATQPARPKTTTTDVESTGTGGVNVSCPLCGWQPSSDDLWTCDCGHAWHTFDSAGRCPACNKTHHTAGCPACAEASDHSAWYPQPTS
jgi:hypothetical protein